MRENWDNAINEINEKYISETAQTLALNVKKQRGEYDYDASYHMELNPKPIRRKSRKGTMIGISAAAAVVALGIGGGVMLTRGNDNPLTGDSQVQEADGPDISQDGVIEFAKLYKEGKLVFTEPTVAVAMPEPAKYSPINELGSEEDIFGFIADFSDIRADISDDILVKSGYVLDMQKSYCNGYADGDKASKQATLCYTNEDAQIFINIGGDGYGSDFSYVSLPRGGNIIPSDSFDDSYIKNYEIDKEFNISIVGIVQDGVPTYCVEFYYNEVLCSISATQCRFSDVTNILAGIICWDSCLHPVDIEPFDVEKYDSFETGYANANDERMLLSESVVRELSDTLPSDSAEPEYNGKNIIPASHVYIRCYYEESGHTANDMLGVYKLTDGNYHLMGKYYYGITDAETDYTAYYEISEDTYNNLLDLMGRYAPYCIVGYIIEGCDMGNGSVKLTEPDKGVYFVKTGDDKVYQVSAKENFDIGSYVMVYYHGIPKVDVVPQINSYLMKKEYIIDLDQSPALPSDAVEDFYGYEHYLMGIWEFSGVQIDYSSGFYSGGKALCDSGEDEHGCYYICNTSPDEVRLYCIFDCLNDPDTMYVYDSLDAKRCEYIGVLERWGAVSNSIIGDMNYMGEMRLINILGEDFGECYNELCSKNDGKYIPHGRELHHRKLVEYNANGSEPYAKVILKYSQQSEKSPTSFYVLHTIKRVNGEWQVTESVHCYEDGEPFVDDNSERVAVSLDMSSGDYTVTLDYIPVKNDENEEWIDVTKPRLYLTDSNGVVHYDDEIFDAANTTILADKNIVLRELPLDSGCAFAVMFPSDLERGSYGVYFYAIKDGKFRIFTEENYEPENETWVTEDFVTGVFDANSLYDCPGENTVGIDMGVSAYAYVFDCDAMEVNTAWSFRERSNDIITIDYSKALKNREGLQIAMDHFFGYWGEEMGLSEKSFESFFYRGYWVGCYEDEDGYYALSTQDAYYISKDDTELMYYISTGGVSRKYSIEHCVCDESFGKLDVMYESGSELNDLGLMYISSILSGDDNFDIAQFYDIEFIDENGTRWTRPIAENDNLQSVYETKINDKQAFLLKMQNADDPEDMRYFSFFFDFTDGKLSWTDEHYCIDDEVYSIYWLHSDYAISVKEKSDERGYGSFIMNVVFFVRPDGSYYAQRMMGNSQAQWLSDSEIFYNDGNGYALVSDKLGSVETSVIGDRLYAVYNGDDGLMLNVYDKTDLIDSMTVSSSGENVNMGTSMLVHGEYLIVEYNANGAEQYAVLYTSSGKPRFEWYSKSSVTLNADGTVTIV
ncbi:MAG: hypothetical protein E7485_00800 [Ruminococcaceae bacterium]|nr:hypothetical protein [Oscillospiraceae bacterium]